MWTKHRCLKVSKQLRSLTVIYEISRASRLERNNFFLFFAVKEQNILGDFNMMNNSSITTLSFGSFSQTAKEVTEDFIAKYPTASEADAAHDITSCLQSKISAINELTKSKISVPKDIPRRMALQNRAVS